MLFHIFNRFTNIQQYIAIASIAAFVICFVMLKLKLPFLPKDKGRAFAVNGEVSKGKIRGVGIIMIGTFVLCSVFLLPVTKEFVFYDILIFLEMLSGYLDDASDKPWLDYKKGLSGCGLPRLIVRLPCGSPSISRTFFPACAKPIPRLAQVVVLPTPPFWLAMVVADKWFTSISSDLSTMRQPQRAHSKSFTVCSVSVLFYFGQIQTNLVKTYQLVFCQQRPISDTEIGG